MERCPLLELIDDKDGDDEPVNGDDAGHDGGHEVCEC